jgi:hypothetical protein
MKRNIWLFLLSPLLVVLTGVPANAASINLSDLLSGAWTLQSTDLGTATLNDGVTLPDGTVVPPTVVSLPLGDGTILGSGIAGPSNLTLTGSDCSDPTSPAVPCALGDLSGFGANIATFTQFTTVITDATAGDLTFNWNYTTGDAGSFYDPAGYFYCAATSDPGSCGPGGGLFQLTMDFDGLLLVSGSSLPGGMFGGISDPSTNSAFNPADGSFTLPNPPDFAESGTVTVSGLSAGDTFGVWVASNNQFGAAQITLSDVAPTLTPEPASFLLIGGGLLALGWAGRKKARRQQEEKTTVV